MTGSVYHMLNDEECYWVAFEMEYEMKFKRDNINSRRLHEAKLKLRQSKL